MSTAAKLIRDHKALLPQDGPVPNRRILVIDDEPEIARGIQRILCPQDSAPKAASRSSRSLKIASDIATRPTTAEFDVVVVHTPKDALHAIRQAIQENRPFAMGFFDVMLGADIDGIELVKQAMQIDPRMIAVFVTAYHDRSVDTIGAYLGQENHEKWDYINKPFTDGEILQKARNVTSLWDLQRLKDWQAERLNEMHGLLLHNERQNAAAAVGRSVAHEFGNLLTHIIGHAEIASQLNDPQAMKNSLDIILKAADTASSVLKRFRNISEAQEQSVEFKLTDLQYTIEEALELMEFRFRRQGIQVDKSGLKPILIEAHRSSLIQVFVNVFINAMHAMKQEGTLFVSVDQEQDIAVIRIRDTGPGIPLDILPKVTEPLFTTKGKDGSGLGLAICKEIIEIEHGGELKIDNHAQNGAEVTLRLPLRHEEYSHE